jgi:Leucine-rich repeat (LRR) protein
LTSLSTLHLAHNSLQQLPAALQHLVSLTSLSLGSNQMFDLPQGFLVGLSCLRQLDLSGNGLDDAALQQAAAVTVAAALADAAAAAGWVAVEGDRGQAGSRPASPLGPQQQQQQQRQCSLENTAAVSAEPLAAAAAAPTSPTAAASEPPRDTTPVPILPQLLTLDVSFNKLQQLPMWLPKSLHWLSASHNSISQLPSALCVQLAGSLQGLELQDNQLAALPAELKAMSALQLLALAGNPGMHPDVVEKGAGLGWAYRWLAEKKQAAAAAALKSSHRHQY